MEKIMLNLISFTVVTTILLTIVFHFLFIKFFPLSKMDWKKVDYFWITAGFIGLIGSTSKYAEEFASNFAQYAEHRVKNNIYMIEESLQFGTGPVVCRTFVKSDLSPPEEIFNKTQNEYNSQCIWFKKAYEKFPLNEFSEFKIINRDAFGETNLVLNKGEKYAFTKLLNSVDQYNESVAEYQDLTSKAKKSTFVSMLIFLSFFLLPAAIAIRLTKVTGEIHLENEKNKTS